MGKCYNPEAVTAALLRIFSLLGLSRPITLIAVSLCILNKPFLAKES